MMLSDLLKSPAVAALIAGIFGLIGLWLGLGRFRSERWWERKAAAYATIIEALHVLEDVEDEEIDANEKMVHLPMERLETLRQKSIKAREETRKGANLGGFVVTNKTADFINEMTHVLERPYSNKQSPHDYQNMRWKAISKALEAVKAEAKKDLQTGGYFFRWR